MNSSGKGFTLIEILVALAILGVVSTLVLASMTSSLRASRESRINAAASEYAQAVVERYRAFWSVPNNYRNKDDFNLFSEPSRADLNVKLGSFRLSQSVDVQGVNADATRTLYVPPAAVSLTDQRLVPPLRRVVVTVTDTSGKVRARLETVIGNPDPPRAR